MIKLRRDDIYEIASFEDPENTDFGEKSEDKVYGLTTKTKYTLRRAKELKQQIRISNYILEWLINHKVQCMDRNCLCEASTPVDALVDLYEKSGDIVLAEALSLSYEKIEEVKSKLG